MKIRAYESQSCIVASLYQILVYVFQDFCWAVASLHQDFRYENKGMRKSVLLCCIGSFLDWKLFQSWIGAFQDSCFSIGKKGHVNFSVASEVIGLEAFSKFGICDSRFLWSCWVAPRFLGRKKGLLLLL